MEGLGDWFMNATLEARRKVPPGSDYEQGEHGVPGNKHPRRRVVVEQLLKPVLDEAAPIRRFARARTQPHFQGGERADEAEPRLRDNDSNSRNMSDSKPGIVYPAPALQVAYDDKQQPSDDKHRNTEVNDQHGIGEQKTERWIEQHKLPNVRHERRAKGREAAFGTSARWRG